MDRHVYIRKKILQIQECLSYILHSLNSIYWFKCMIVVILIYNLRPLIRVVLHKIAVVLLCSS